MMLGPSEMRLCDPEMYQLNRSEEHTSELQSQSNLVCRLLLEKKKNHRGSACLIPPASAGLATRYPSRMPCSAQFLQRLFSTITLCRISASSATLSHGSASTKP